jgi:DNA-binding beta-propeller fold protein YncE
MERSEKKIPTPVTITCLTPDSSNPLLSNISPTPEPTHIPDKKPLPAQTLPSINFFLSSPTVTPLPTPCPTKNIDSSESYIFVRKWGSSYYKDNRFGSSNIFTTDSKGPKVWQFSFPIGITTDIKGYVYVLDYDNSLIQKFDSSGNFIRKWGSWGKFEGQVKCPRGITTDYNNNIYVADGNIQKFDSSGNFITKWELFDDNNKKFTDPYAIAIDTEGNVFVVSTGNQDHILHKFTPEGQTIKTWDINEYNDKLSRQCVHYLEDIVIDSYGYIYVVDSLIGTFEDPLRGVYDDICESYVKKFDSNGSFILKWGGERLFPGHISIGLDTRDNILVANSMNNIIQTFDSNGKLISTFGSHGKGDGEFNRPWDITSDHEGNIYVTDYGNHQVQKFKPNPEFKTKK